MDKLLDYSSETDVSKNLYPIRHSGGSLIKHADSAEWPPVLLKFIQSMIPEDNFHYSLCNALGAGEFWSSNINGDFFEKDELIEHHGSFLRGTPFMHHVNKDPNKGYGKILFSTYNPKMNRVELVVGHDTTKLPKNIVKKLERDELVNLSMGCKVPYDTCSICGNDAPTPTDYCKHVKDQGLNYVYPDGRKVFLYNPDPDFFDISIVIVPADKTACVLAKIFGAIANTDPLRGLRGMVLPSSMNAELAKTADVNEKKASIIDTVPNKPWETLRDIAIKTKTAGGLARSIRVSNSFFKPNEVQAMLFCQMGYEKIAGAVLENNIYFESNVCLIDSLPNDGHVIKLANNHSANAAAFSALLATGSPLTGVPVDTSFFGSLGITPDLMSDISRASMLAALIGMTMTTESQLALPAIAIGSAIAARAMRPDPGLLPEELAAQKLRMRDLYIEPLIRAKKADKNLTLKELYSIPFM